MPVRKTLLGASERTTCLFCLAAIISTFAPAAHAQSGFDQAHKLLAELDKLQKSGKRDRPTLDHLKGLVGTVPYKVPDLLAQGTLDLLNSPGTYGAEEIRMKISSALQIVPASQSVPEVFVFPITLEAQTSYLVAYNLPYCAACSRAWIGLIGKRAGRYVILSESGSAFSNKSLHVFPLARNEKGRDRFLIYGTNWGDAHNRLTAAAYVFEGASLRRFWARTDLPEGNVKATPSRITLSFLTALRPPWNERTEVYKILPADQIELQKSFERPDA